LACEPSTEKKKREKGGRKRVGRQGKESRGGVCFFLVFLMREKCITYGSLTKKGEHYMQFKKVLIFVGLILAIGLFGCAGEKKAEAPKQEQVTKDLVPPKSELKGQNFFVELSDLKVVTTVIIASKEIVGTPSLKGHIKITNKTKDILDIQALTLEYLDEAGKPIPYKPDEKIEKVYAFWKALQPEGITEGSLDVTIPVNAVKDKSLKKIEVNLVYVPSPLKRETLTLSEKIE
jgi:hypothetical protein